MSSKRVLSEKRTILILGIIVFVVFGILFSVKFFDRKTADEDQLLIDAVKFEEYPNRIEVYQKDDSYVLIKNGQDWVYEQNEYLPISQLDVTMKRTLFKFFAPNRVIKDGSEYIDRFGFNDPQTKITFYLPDRNVTAIVGDYNPLVDEYYLKMEGDNTIYLISSSDGDILNQTICDIVGEPDITTLDYDSVVRYEIKGEEDFSIVNNGNNWTVVSEDRTIDTTNHMARTVLSAFETAQYKCVDISADNSNLSEYGLNIPSREVRVETADGKETILSLGVGSDGTAFFCQDYNGIIYSMTQEYYSLAVSRTLTDYFE